MGVPAVRWVSMVLGVLVARALATGCTGQKHSDDGEPVLGPIPVITDYTQVVMPLDAYFQSGEQIAMDGYASDLIVQQCMREFGLDWTVRVPTSSSSSTRNDRRYGVIDAAQAAKYGYSEPPAADKKTGSGPAISADQDAILTGRGQGTFNGKAVPEGGCVGEARRKLEAGAPPLETAGQPGLVERLNHDLGAKADNDSRVRAVFSQWRACMKEAGYDYAAPWDANDDPHWKGAVTPEQIATAKADVNCRVRTNLVGTWYAVEVAYQKRAIEQYASQLSGERSYLENRSRNVAKIVAGALNPSPVS